MYNGHENKETWATIMHIQSNEYDQYQTKNMTRENLREYVEEKVLNNTENLDPLTLDFIFHTLARIDYHGIEEAVKEEE